MLRISARSHSLPRRRYIERGGFLRWFLLFVGLNGLAFYLSAAPIEFSVTQARAEWMPGATNLRWNGQRLESLFFVLVESDAEQADLSLTIEGKDWQRSEKIAAVRPITEQKASEILALDPTWFATEDDIKSQQFASRRTLAQFWLPVEASQPLAFALVKKGAKIARQTLNPSVETPVWLQTKWAGETEDPWLHEQALFPRDSVMIQEGRPISLTLELVGTGAGKVPTFTAEFTVRENSASRALWQKRVPISARLGELTEERVNFPTSAWNPGRYIVDVALRDEGEKTVATAKRGLVVVPPKVTVNRFGATYADLVQTPSVYHDPAAESEGDRGFNRYHATHWGPHADVVVSFEGSRDHLVFAHTNHSYNPFWYVNDLGINWEWVEGHDDELGSLEVPYDRECRYSRVSIVSSMPARAIVHWRYNTTARTYDRFFDEWVDEYYTIYPDRTVVRKIMGFFRRRNWHESFEPILQGPAGLHLREALEDEHFTWLNLTGRKISMDPLNMWKNWTDRWQEFRANDPRRTTILQLNLRGGRKFFHAFADLRRVYSLWAQLIEDENGRREAPAAREVPYGIAYVAGPDDLRSHWNSYCLFDAQAALLKARTLPDGRQLTPEELEAESNNPMSQTKDMPDDRIESTWAYLLGLGDQVDPMAVTRAWVTPASVTTKTGASFLGYDPAERAYRFRKKVDGGAVVFRFSPQSDAPQIHPVFLVEGIAKSGRAVVSANGRELTDDERTIGFEPEPAGTFRLVVFTRLTLSEPVEVTIEVR